MRKITKLIVLMLMIASLTACGSKVETSPIVDDTPVVEEVTVDETTEDVVIEETEEIIEEATEEVTEDEDTTEETPVEETVEEKPVVEEPVAKTVNYTYTDMSATMYAKQTVNVRDLPSTDGNKLGGLVLNDEVKVTGKCNETSWYQIEYKGNVAYVSDKYLADNKTEITVVADAKVDAPAESKVETPVANTSSQPLKFKTVTDTANGDGTWSWGNVTTITFSNEDEMWSWIEARSDLSRNQWKDDISRNDQQNTTHPGPGYIVHTAYRGEPAQTVIANNPASDTPWLWVGEIVIFDTNGNVAYFSAGSDKSTMYTLDRTGKAL